MSIHTQVRIWLLDPDPGYLLKIEDIFFAKKLTFKVTNCRKDLDIGLLGSSENQQASIKWLILF